MTADAFRFALHNLGMTQSDAAKFLGVQPTTVNRWARGTRKIPGPVEAALQTLRKYRILEAEAARRDQLFGTAGRVIVTGPIKPR